MGEDNPWITFPTPEAFETIDLDRILKIYEERFADASNFKFVFVGNIDMDTFKPLVEKYIASLPATASNESYKNLSLNIKAGKITENVYVGVDEKSQVSITLSGDYEYDMNTNGLMSAVAGILTNKND